MTVVARLFIDKYPVLIGDLLISGLEEPNSRKDFPTISDISDIFPEGSGFVPSELSQKIAMIGENLVIAWAGSRIAAKTVIKDLIENARQEPFTPDSLKLYFSNLDESIRTQNVAFVGFVSDPERITHFGFKCESLETEFFGKVGILGTGSAAIKSFLSQVSELPQPTRGRPNKMRSAVSMALYLTGIFHNLELATRQSLLDYYGGGYEIATFKDGRFQKVDDIRYIFWSAHIEGEEVRISHPLAAFKYSYFNDTLVIRSGISRQIKSDEGHHILTIRDTIYTIPPIYEPPKITAATKFTVSLAHSEWLCNLFFVNFPDGRREIYNRVDYRSPAERLIKFVEHGKMLTIEAKPEFIDQVKAAIYQRYCT